MRLFGPVAAPAIERVVDWHRGIELGRIVPEHPGIAERDRQQPSRLRRQIGQPGIGATNDRRQTQQGVGLEIEFLKHHVERAGVTSIVPDAASTIEWSCREPLGNGGHLRRRNGKEYGCGIDETADQPWAGNSNDLWPCSRDPSRPAGFVAFREPVRAEMRLVGFAPCFEPTFKRLGVDACVPKPSGGSLAEIAAVLAIDDYAS